MALILSSITKDDFMTSIDKKETYFQILIHQEFRQTAQSLI